MKEKEVTEESSYDNLPDVMVKSESAIPQAVITSSRVASETTLLTPAQTYFADEKISIPESETVCVLFFSFLLFLFNLRDFF